MDCFQSDACGSLATMCAKEAVFVLFERCIRLKRKKIRENSTFQLERKDVKNTLQNVSGEKENAVEE